MTIDSTRSRKPWLVIGGVVAIACGFVLGVYLLPAARTARPAAKPVQVAPIQAAQPAPIQPAPLQSAAIAMPTQPAPIPDYQVRACALAILNAIDVRQECPDQATFDLGNTMRLQALADEKHKEGVKAAVAAFAANYRAEQEQARAEAYRQEREREQPAIDAAAAAHARQVHDAYVHAFELGGLSHEEAERRAAD